MTNEAFLRDKIDAQLRDQGWEITNTNAVRFEYVLCDRPAWDYAGLFYEEKANHIGCSKSVPDSLSATRITSRPTTSSLSSR